MNNGNTPKGVIPQGDYLPAKRFGGMIFTSGMTPRQNGVLMFTGPVRKDAAIESYRNAVNLACGNALWAARSLLRDGEAISGILSLTVFIAAEPGYEAHAKVADLASQFLRVEIGQDGIGTRAAIGVATLPGNAPVEVQIIATV